MRARDAFNILKKDIMRIIQPFLYRGEYCNPRLFGSIVRGKDTVDSDIDILLSRGPKYNSKSAIGLYRDMINSINFPIDIVIEDLLPSYIDISYATPIQHLQDI